MYLVGNVKKWLVLLSIVLNAHAMESISPLLPHGVPSSGAQPIHQPPTFHFTHTASQDAKLLYAIHNGPGAHDHPFVQAGYVVLSPTERFEATLATNEVDTLTSSMAVFAQNSLLGQSELKLKEPAIKVRKVLEHFKERGRLALICVHGTFSKEIGFGDNLEKQSTHSIIDFAKKLGVSYNKAVYIISFAWSGELSLEARRNAGAQLAAYVTAQNKYDTLWTIAHSHGCNVVNWAAFKMLEDGYVQNIDMAIHLASPTPDIQREPTDGLSFATPETCFNIKKLLHFYGSHDVTGLMGSIIAGWDIGRKTRAGTESNCSSYNIRTQLNNQPLDHMSIKQVLAHLPGLIHAIETYYECFFDLDANLSTLPDGTQEYPMVSIRKRSKDQQHPAVRNNYRRGVAYSEFQAERFIRLHNHSINDKSSLFWRIVAAPLQEYWNKSTHDTFKALPTDQQEN